MSELGLEWTRPIRRMAAGLQALASGQRMERLREKKRALTEREEELRALSDASPGMMAGFHLREDGSVCMPYVSPRIWELFGLRPQDVVDDAAPLLVLIHPDDFPRVRESAVRSARAMTSWHEEFRTMHPTRGVCWMESHSNPQHHPNGGVVWYGFVHDITERKHAQTAIRERLEFQQRVVKFAEVAPGALFTLRRTRDGKLSMPWAADKLVEIVGCWPEDARQDISALTACIHVGDVDTWRRAATVSAHTLLPWHCEFRLAHPIRGEVWIEWRATPARESQGGVLWHGFLYDVTERKDNEHQLSFMAHHDTLTGLPNRVLLTDRMQQAIAQSRRTGEFLAVLFIDLDGFKPVNDRYGHEAGDRTLIEIGLRLTRMLRGGDTVARIGGDEFVVLLPGLASVEECECSTQRLLKAITEPVHVGAQPIMLSASIGIALYPDDSDDADSLLRRADEAMYAAKRTGRNQFVRFGNDAQPASALDGGMVHDLRLALELDQIDVHYQPIVDLATGRVHKAEALVRWKHPQKGYVPPVEFIPIAEESGLIHAIGSRVFQKAVQTTREWNDFCADGVTRRISVNRSPREFYGHDGANDWIAHLNNQGGCADMLSLEITEGLLLSDRPKVLAQLRQLRAMGMTVALDDFGTGYSSLSYLKKFDIDYIKIDRSFVLDIVDDPADRAIVESIIVMARKLGIKLIAEGVETQAQAALLAAAHCDFAQGYLYARPMPQREFLDFVRAIAATPLPVPGLLTHVGRD